MHKKFSLDNLIIQLGIEEETRNHDQKDKVNYVSRKNPTVVLKQCMKNYKKSQSRSIVHIVCYNCNKPRHLARNYRNKNRHAVQLITCRNTKGQKDICATPIQLFRSINHAWNIESTLLLAY